MKWVTLKGGNAETAENAELAETAPKTRKLRKKRETSIPKALKQEENAERGTVGH